jgi:hypothetical protein
MWPRRPRMMRRLLRRAYGIPVVDPQLAEAHRLFSAGQYPQAADQFEMLANQAQARGGLRAPYLLVQAGLSRVYAGQGTSGMPSIFKGLAMIDARHTRLRLRRTAQRVMSELQVAGYLEGAREVAAWLAGQPFNESDPGTAAPSAQPPRKNLPLHCPGCGGPVNPEEVDWLNEDTAECVYCGSPIRAETP